MKARDGSLKQLGPQTNIFDNGEQVADNEKIWGDTMVIFFLRSCFVVRFAINHLQNPPRNPDGGTVCKYFKGEGLEG